MARPRKADRPQEMTAYPQEPVASDAGSSDSAIAHYTRQFETFERSVAGEPAPISALRRHALERFAALGFPTTKNEDWHFTSVAPIATRAFELVEGAGHAVTRADVERFAFGAREWPTLVFVDGQLATELSSGVDALPAGASAGSLRASIAGRDDLPERWLGKIADFESTAFTAWNTAFFSDGAVIHAARDTIAEQPVHLLFVSTGRPAGRVSHPRNLIVVERGARIAVIESYVGLSDGGYLTNAVTEIVVEDGARLDHIKIQRETSGSQHVGTSDTRQGRDSVYHSFSYATGAELSRTNVYTQLDGEGGSAELNGLYMVTGTQHVDHQTRIEHAQPNCTSHEVYKGILDGKSHGVFNGKVYVRPEAQKTDGKQSNNNLLLSPDARVDTKPQLEIFADDVKCTHGATVGRLDENAMFYLRSRGIDPARARTILMYAFAAAVLEQIAVEPVRDALESLVLARVSGEPVAA